MWRGISVLLFITRLPELRTLSLPLVRCSLSPSVPRSFDLGATFLYDLKCFSYFLDFELSICHLFVLSFQPSQAYLYTWRIILSCSFIVYLGQLILWALMVALAWYHSLHLQ